MKKSANFHSRFRTSASELLSKAGTLKLYWKSWMTTLKEAREKGNLNQFIKEREAEQGNPDTFNRAVRSMAQTSKEARPASKKGRRGG